MGDASLVVFVMYWLMRWAVKIYCDSYEDEER